MIGKELADGWEFAGPDGVWRAAQIPGHVHLDLMRHGLIQDPFVGMNEKDCQWVDEADWSYRCRFEWERDSEVDLRFDGLDTICRVFLNGEHLAGSDNMFLPLEVRAQLRGGVNELRVEFQSAARVGRERRAAYVAEQGLSADTANFDERAFVRKAQYMFGWDWGPRLVSCGIWKPVWVRTEGGAEAGCGRPVAKARLIRNADSWGESFEFEVDGKPFYALGANWIPDHSFPSIVDRDRLRQRLATAKEMGINMLRIWGGGIYESDDFYDLCDELGILVWQDFMFAGSYYPDTDEWLEKVRQEAEYQVRRLRHHPCIAIWCGNNECHQVWEDGWGGKDRQPRRFYGEVIYHETLREVVERLDPGRPYVLGSPFGGDYCNAGSVGDQHFWDVWHGRGDWIHYRDSTARFCSEFGFASSPSKATWKRAGVNVSVKSDDLVARWHNKTGKPFETFQNLVELHYPKAESLDEWSYYSQLNQRDAMRSAIEHYRFSEACRGALIWQLNDCWPVESWSLLEFEGRKKAAAHDLSRLFAPLLLRIRATEERVVLEAVSQNTDQTYEGSAILSRVWSAIYSDGARVKPAKVTELLSFEPPVPAAPIWVGQFGNAMTVLRARSPIGTDYEPPLRTEILDRTVNLVAEGLAVDVYLEDLKDPANSFEPNFFTLLPGGTTSVEASQPIGKLAARCLRFD